MIKAEERYLLLQAGFTERQINTQMQKFYSLFRVAPMPQMKKEWVGLTDENIFSLLVNLQEMYVRPPTTDSRFIFARAIEAKLKEKNSG